MHTTAGSVANIEMLREGEADLALVLTATARAAQGTALLRRPVPLRAIGRVYETYLQFVVRADSSVRTVSDLAAHTVSLGAAGSGAAELGELILHAAGLVPGSDVSVLHLPLAEAADAIKAGTVGSRLVAGGVPLPALTDVDDSPGLRFPPLADLLPRLGDRDARAGSGLEEVSLPQGAYRTAGGAGTTGMSNLLVLRASALVPGNAVGTQFLDVCSLIGMGGIALHPGAQAAYRGLRG
ncbi:TAXI family TRAP transporter solute-binding subunit [Streptomyces sp. NPDC090106]|uniref:TAXI family TRAP transporter solute-binding subunit n=1 Tax=Streptomyces sp. NPDC090106 TaxID=3365946 RepID=UPI00382FDBE3